jgi:hypothetical protein
MLTLFIKILAIAVQIVLCDRGAKRALCFWGDDKICISDVVPEPPHFDGAVTLNDSDANGSGSEFDVQRTGIGL